MPLQQETRRQVAFNRQFLVMPLIALWAQLLLLKQPLLERGKFPSTAEDM